MGITTYTWQKVKDYGDNHYLKKMFLSKTGSKRRTKKLIEVIEQVLKLRKQFQTIYDKLETKKDELRALCNHPLEQLTLESHYYYDDWERREYNSYHMKCAVCNQEWKLDEKI